MISREAVREIAALARLQLTSEEEVRLANDLGRITGYIDSLADAGVLDQQAELAPQVTVESLRADLPTPSVRPSIALSNAPGAEAGYFKMPKIVE